MINSKNIQVYYDQQTEGNFKYFVTFGDCAPWDTPDDQCIECVSEVEVYKLKNLLNQIYNDKVNE